MSLDLGHSRGYVQNISSGKSLPSVEGLFEICDYFGLTPAQFFDESIDDPALVAEAVKGLRQLSDSDKLLILNHIYRFIHGCSEYGLIAVPAFIVSYKTFAYLLSRCTMGATTQEQLLRA